MRYSRIPFHAATLWSSLVCLAAGGGVGGGGASIPLSPQEEEERGDGDGDGRRRLHRGGEGEKKRSRSDFLVTGLDEVVPAYAEFDGEMYAGLLPMDNNSKGHRQRRSGELMFWLFEPSKPAVDDSVVMWLNGGPGCSSFTAGECVVPGERNGSPASWIRPSICLQKNRLTAASLFLVLLLLLIHS